MISKNDLLTLEEISKEICKVWHHHWLFKWNQEPCLAQQNNTVLWVQSGDFQIPHSNTVASPSGKIHFCRVDPVATTSRVSEVSKDHPEFQGLHAALKLTVADCLTPRLAKSFCIKHMATWVTIFSLLSRNSFSPYRTHEQLFHFKKGNVHSSPFRSFQIVHKLMRSLNRKEFSGCASTCKVTIRCAQRDTYTHNIVKLLWWIIYIKSKLIISSNPSAISKATP